MSSIQRVCSVADCEEKHLAKSYCKYHYTRMYLYGTLVPTRTLHNHNLSNTEIYRLWMGMKSRCYYLGDINYKDYGEKGIGVCALWKESLLDFTKDMGKRPSKKYSIDRIDSSMGYTCGHCEECLCNNWTANCRWATSNQQIWNRRKSKANKSGYIGVNKVRAKWGAGISYTREDTGKKFNWSLGLYDTKEEAAIAYDKAAVFLRGEYAVTNFL